MFSVRVRDVKAAVAKACNLCDSVEDLPRILDYLNRAVERLLYEGKFKGTVQTFRICLDANGCVTWPREIETIEAIALCHAPTPIRTEWYEFNENGPGVIDDEHSCLNALVDRGEAPAFDEVVGADKKLAVYAERTEGIGKFINLQFYTEFGQWATSTFNGEVIDGEQIAIPATAGAYNYTVNKVKPGGLIRVKKDLTLGLVRLYEYNTTNGALKPLAYYQADEEVPTYRRSLIPGMAHDSCDQQQVVVRAKLRFIPARTAESFVLISHREAIRLACSAVFLEEGGFADQAAINWAIALRLLNKQLEQFIGSGARAVPQFATSAVWGGWFQPSEIIYGPIWNCNFTWAPWKGPKFFSRTTCAQR